MNASASMKTGPEAGQPFPTFVLPDQHGRIVDFTTSRNGREAMVVFFRSADW
jgi:peroxiredoxin